MRGRCTIYPYVVIAPDCHSHDFYDNQDLGGLVAVIGSYGELSVIVTRLGCESVVCLDNDTQWLRRLYVLILFYYFLLFVAFEEWRIHPCNH